MPSNTWKCGIASLTCASFFYAAPARAQMPASPLIVSETSVIRFTPEIPSGDVREGSCSTVSIAAPTRRDAYRCEVGDGIYDPCFRLPPIGDRLVCDADPALKTGGFLLKLTNPTLPAPSHAARSRLPWIFRLADNSICEPTTGTLPAVNDEPARWSCAIHIRDQVRPVGVVTRLTAGKIWMADKFPQSAVGTKGALAEKVPVKVVWE
jgi:hypothetical protein